MLLIVVKERDKLCFDVNFIGYNLIVFVEGEGSVFIVFGWIGCVWLMI